MNPTSRTLWLRWIGANAASELVGLGTTFLVIGLLTPQVSGQHTPAAAVLALAIAVGSGAIEATLVGLAQWWAMSPYFPSVGRLAWWRATLFGALFGYVLGYLPSTLADFGDASGQAVATEPPQWIVLILAAGLGAVAGAILSFLQWRVLRKHVAGAGIWIPANMLAWALGMPVIFEAMDLAFKVPELWQRVAVVAVGLLTAGTVVGAVHGRALVLLAERAGATQPSLED